MRALTLLLPSLPAPKHPLEPARLARTPAVRLLLQLREPPRLGVYVLHLPAPVGVELGDLLAGGRVGGLLKVRVEAAEEAAAAGGDAVGLVGGAGAVRGVVLGVEVLDGGEEARGDVVLVVEVDGALEGRVADDVALGEVLGQDAGARFHLLRELVGGLVALGRVAAAVRVGGGRLAGDGDGGVAQLGVVEEEGRLESCLPLEGDGCGLGVARGGDLDVGDLAAVEFVSLGDFCYSNRTVG